MRKTLVAVTLAVFLTAIACGDDGSTAPENDDFLPVFTAFWHNTADQTHTFVFFSNDDGLATGTVTGTETHPTFGDSDVEGTFQNSVATLTVKRPGGDRVYTGKFLHLDTLRIFRTGETILLAR